MIFALASNDETTDHLDTLFETKSLTDRELYESVKNQIQALGRMLNNFLDAIGKHHNEP